MLDDSEGFSDSDEDDFDEDSESESDGEEGVVHRKGIIAKLEAEARETPYSADVHVALISSLREAAKLSRLREVRLSAASLVALPESIWVEWLQDETNLAEDGDFEKLDDLHKRACEAHPLSSKIWLARCAQYRERAERQGGSSEAREKVRAVFEEALEVVGLHPTEGPEVWADYRMFEESILAGSKGEESVEQAQRLRMLFFRQLALPMPGLERLQEAHKTFEASLEPAAQQAMSLEKASAIAEEAAESWQERESLEGKLVEASRPMLTVSITAAGAEDKAGSSAMAKTSAQLLSMDEATGDPARILVGHLRATSAAPGEAPRWLALASFLEDTVGDVERATSALERAVRSQPHVAALWVQLLVCREALGASLADLGGIARRGVSALKSAPAGSSAELLEFLFHHADVCRRLAVSGQPQAGGHQLSSGAAWTEMRSVFEQAVQLAETPDAEPGSNCQVLLRWMRLEAYVARDLEKALSIGYRLLEFWGAYYNGWSAFIAATRFCCGSNSYAVVSKLYRSALEQVTDYPSQIQSDYLEFERECGTLLTWRAAKRESAQRAQQEAAASALQHEKEEKPQQPTIEPEKHGAEETSPDTSALAGKKPNAAAAPVQSGAEIEEGAAGMQRPSKRQKKREKQLAAQQLKEQQKKKDQAKEEASAAPAVAPAVKATELMDTLEAPKQGEAAQADAPAQDAERTSQEAADTKASAPQTSAGVPEPEVAAASMQASVQEIPGTAQPQEDAPAPVAEVVPTPPAGVPESGCSGKGAEAPIVASTAAVASTEAAAGSTVKGMAPRTGAHFHQRQLPKDGGKAAGAPAPEHEGEKTVFVSGLDWSVNDATLHRIFQEIDGLQEVRLVTDFLGRSKGYAYIDYATSEAVAAAVEKFNGHLVNKRPMKVARSLPTKTLYEEKTVFVAQVAAAAKEKDIRDAFSSFGEIEAVRMPQDKATGEHKGYAYVEFKDASSLESALRAPAPSVAGQQTKVARSIPMKDHRHTKAAPRRDLPQRLNQKQVVRDKELREDPVLQAAKHPTTVYVKNLDFDVDDEKLKSHFASCGKIEQTLICRNALGRSRGFGFVEFESPEHAQAALLMSDTELLGRKIVVSRSQRAITQKKSVPAEEESSSKAEAENAPSEKRWAAVPPPSKKRKLMVDSASVASEDSTKANAHVAFRTTTNTAGSAEKAEARPLSNADFRKFLLG